MKIKTSSLALPAYNILINKGTESPFTGFYNEFDQPGTYLCRQCGLALYRAQSKFHSGCGWPSYDEAVKLNVGHVPDKDGRRTEIVCQRCLGHLGHVFVGEGFTPKNTRHCVNSLSLDFVTDLEIEDTAEIILAAGCFWGVEYYLKRCPGVLKTEVGYIGGQKPYPSYEAVCTGTTGYLEAIRVLFDPTKITYQQLVQYFFEIHDFTQTNGQGPDIGEQYLSAIFVYDEEESRIAHHVIGLLKDSGYAVATQVRTMSPFWPAEDYHQDYYKKLKKLPYCHRHQKIFS